jgi:hypothetical protein
VNGTVFVDSPDNGILADDYCEDVLGKANDHAMLIEHFDGRFIQRLNGDMIFGPGYETTYTDAMVDSFYTNRGHLAVSLPSVSDRAITLIARTNPSRPGVTPLTLAQDVIELPKMLRDVGRLLSKKKKHVAPRDLAKWNLAIQFGWIPLIHDVSALLHFQSSVDKRARELERLWSKGGLKRRLKLGNAHAEAVVTPVIIDTQLGATVYGIRKTYTSARSWGTIRWLPTALPPAPPGTAKFNQYARNVVSGWTITGLNQGAWDILPWSWIVDWFSNTGDYMLANSAGVPCGHLTPNIMTETTSQHSYSRLGSGGDASWVTGGTGNASFVSKRRDLSSGSLSAHLPFLNGKQLSILGSLFVQRFRGL